MRIPIREQLALLVLTTCLVALAIISIATWVNNYNFVIGVREQGLSLTASLKAAQITADLELLQSTCGTVVSRLIIQQALRRFYTGNTTDANWSRSITDVQAALNSGGYSTLLQAIIFSKNGSGNGHGLLNVTGAAVQPVTLPYDYPNGTAVMLGDPGLGFPPMLYPNLTYVPTSQTDPNNNTTNLTTVYAFPDVILNATSSLLLGPLPINSSYSIVSLTLPMIDTILAGNVLGYMTLVASASNLYNLLSSREGLDDTGIALLLGPARVQNLFTYQDRPITPTSDPVNATALASAAVDFVFKPTPITDQADRHSQYNANGASFPLSSYSAAYSSLSQPNRAINNATSDLSTYNEQGSNVAVGVARPQTTLVDWVIVVEQTHDEAWAPIVQLRNILLACVFGTAGLMALLVLPMAHFGVLPIRKLKEATEKSVRPPGYSPTGSIRFGEGSGDEESVRTPGQQPKKQTWIAKRIRHLRHGSRRKSKAERNEDARRRIFKIPGKVQDKKHFITDELTELTSTFNEMSDELMMQYAKLEERVAQRTRDLEVSKKAAEAANESKTLFIANISHELKTPLNGILGMCAVCMGEDDLTRMKKSLQIVYKSGDLLLHLLNDLLTFSKNQIGEALSLDEKEFGLAEIKSQITTIFDKQAREGHIDFGFRFTSADGTDPQIDASLEKPLPAQGPPGTGRLKDMRLWGDQHRILQVLINLVSNSLKFTPTNGKVEVRIRCIGEEERSLNLSKGGSIGSKQGSQRRSKVTTQAVSTESNASLTSKEQSIVAGASKLGDSSLFINPVDPKSTQSPRRSREQTTSPPLANSRILIFEFEVQDTGPGIPVHLQQRIFEPFVQGDLGLTKKFGGTGLGLSICSQLSSLMGGSITLDSTEGVGTTFKMRIPLKYVKEMASSTTSSSISGSRPASAARSIDDARSLAGAPGPSGVTSTVNQDDTVTGNSTLVDFEKDRQPRLVGLSQPFFANAPPPPSAGITSGIQLQALNRVAANKATPAKIRVLVAEDNLVNQEVVLRMLKLEDIYDVTIAKDGQEAYDMVRASMNEGKVYDVIFMDVQMPNLDGLQSTRLIREMGYSAPIVALTAFAEESNVKECMDSGMNMFLSKPIRRPALKQVLKKFATITEEPEIPSP